MSRVLFFYLVSFLLVVSTVSATGAGDPATESEAVKAAKAAAQSSVSEATRILTAVTQKKTEIETAVNGHKKRASDAKTEADTAGKDIDAVKEYVTKVSTAATNTDSEAQKVMNAATKAMNDAVNAKKEAADAQKEAEGLPSTGEDKDTEAGNAEKAAEKAEQSAKEAETSINGLDKELTNVKNAADNSEIELEKLKIVLENEKLKASLLATESAEQQTEKLKNDVTSHINAIAALLTSNPNLSTKDVEAQEVLSKEAQNKVNTQHDTITSAKDEINKRKTNMDGMISSFDSLTDVAAAKAKTVEAQAAATDSAPQKDTAEKALTTAKNEAIKVEKTLYKCRAIIAVEKTKKAHESAKQHNIDALNKKTSVDTAVQEIESITTKESSVDLTEVTQELKNSQESQKKVNEEIKKADTAQKTAEEKYNEAKKVFEGITDDTVVTEDKTKSAKAEEAVQKSQDEVEKAKNAFNVVTVETNKVLKAKHMSKAIVSVAKAKKASVTAKGYYDEAVKVKSSSSLTLQEIEESLKKYPKGVNDQVTKQLGAAKTANSVMGTETEKANTAQKEAKKKYDEAVNFLNAIKTETSVTEIENKATSAASSESGAEIEVGKANASLTNVKTEADKVTKAKYNTKAVVAAANVQASINNVKTYADQIAQKEKDTSASVKAITDAMGTSTSDEAKSAANAELQIAQNALTTIQEALKNINTAQEEMNKQKDAINAAVIAVEAATVETAPTEYAKVEMAANISAQHEQKAHQAFTTANKEVNKAESAKVKALKVLQSARKDIQTNTKENHSSGEKSALNSTTNTSSQDGKVTTQVQASINEKATTDLEKTEKESATESTVDRSDEKKKDTDESALSNSGSLDAHKDDGVQPAKKTLPSQDSSFSPEFCGYIYTITWMVCTALYVLV